jgi:DNA-directed RNA polymerase subunit K/omega
MEKQDAMSDKKRRDKAPSKVPNKEDDRMEGTGRNTVSSFPNKYEAAIIAAKEARRLNDIIRHSGEDTKEKITLVAIDRVAKGKVKFGYEEQEGRRE